MLGLKLRDEFKGPFADIDESKSRIETFLQRAVVADGGEIETMPGGRFRIRIGEACDPQVFTLDRDLAQNDDHVELMGLDHPLMAQLLRQWRNARPEEIGACTTGPEGGDNGCVLTVWLVQAFGKVQESSTHVVPIAVNVAGQRVPLIEKRYADVFTNGRKRPAIDAGVCANNQLIEQTRMRAEDVGLAPSQRFKGKWLGQASFTMGETFCLTNYHGLFNGLSVFHDEPIDAIIFDDAHVAEAAIRDCFTLRIGNDHAAFGKVVQILRRHFANSARATQFAEAAGGSFTPVLFVPMFVTWQHASEIRQVLVDAGIANSDTKFPWTHIGEHLKHCCILMTGAGLEITPARVPLGVLPYFTPHVRRLYLTATMPSQAAFARTFGIANPQVISPSGKSGDAQRLIVFTPGENDDQQREEAKALVKTYKSCVISPSKKKAAQWVPPSKIYDTDSGQEEIERFRKSNQPEMLGLVARYDGIDLPGKSCNTLVLDRLPTGESLIDRFIDEGIKVETIRLSNTATRVIQAIGRIFRSNTDHGVVVLVGPALQAWMRTPRYQKFLPPRLQQQVHLANALHEQIAEGETDWPELIEGVLTGDAAWDATYKDYIDQMSITESADEVEWYTELVVAERTAYEKLWGGQPGQAADVYSQMVVKATPHDARVATWYRHWHGLSLLCHGDRSRASFEFMQAANVRAELGRPSEKEDAALWPTPARFAGQQATNLAACYAKRRAEILATLSQVEIHLQYGDETAKAEEALSNLGYLLGLDAQRPDKEKSIGPDVLWIGDGGPSVWGFEMKTNKKADGEYSKKDDVGQCHNHEKWIVEQYGQTAELAIVGRFLPVSKLANPSERLRVVELEGFREMLSRTKKVFEAVDGGDKSDIPVAFQTWLNHYGLLWPTCVEALGSRMAADLKEH